MYDSFCHPQVDLMLSWSVPPLQTLECSHPPDLLDSSSNTGKKLCKWDFIGNGKLGDKDKEKFPFPFRAKCHPILFQ